MGLSIEQEQGNAVLRITGLLKKSEFDALQTAADKKMKPTDTFKLLVILSNFQGWERAEGWGDLTFFSKHGDQITKIAIVGDPKWETEFKMFVGAGFRTAPVDFFSPNELEDARMWLAE